LNVLKLEHCCVNDEALNGRSETGSETEQVGSGMNGRGGVERGFRTPGECLTV
jgi:hypothetical protein